MQHKNKNTPHPTIYDKYIPVVPGPAKDDKLTTANKAKEVFWTKVFPGMFPLEKDYRTVLRMSYLGGLVDKFIDDIYRDVYENNIKIEMTYGDKK